VKEETDLHPPVIVSEEPTDRTVRYGSNVRFAIALPHLADAPEFGRIDVMIEIAQALEAAGVDGCSVTDHPFPVVDETETGHHAFDPFVLLGAIAARTSVLRLLHMLVVLPYRNPFLVANAAASVDNASGGGRLVLGVGAGYLEAEFNALGVDFHARGALTEQGIEAIRSAWTGVPLHRRSTEWTAAGNTMPRPLSTPQPPIWMGGNGRLAIERAVRFCDGWAPFAVGGARARNARTVDLGSLDAVRRRIGYARELSERHRREQPLEICLVRPPVAWGEDPSSPAIADEVAEMEDMGIDWVSFGLKAGALSELLEKIDAWRATASALRSPA
jgi:probable F420-dependent oxidoreductase